jgi:phosphoribosylaminoimidazolecarboxamide formyltransferase/IMP cyclohydrolase
MSQTIQPIRRALISVSDKTGLLDLARALAAQGAEILSTGGSAKALRDAGVPVRDVSDYTGFPEILDGRVKTLVPMIHGGILGRRDLPSHQAQMREHGIGEIDLVAVNLYPFEKTVASGADSETCIENIDIGGPALIRAAAKNHAHVVVLTDPAQYEGLIDALGDGGTTLAMRTAYAGAAYARTAAYDAAIAAWFAAAGAAMRLAERFALTGQRAEILRYGENPHQQAAFYRDGSTAPRCGDGRAGAGQGAVLQQHQRYGRRVRGGGRVRCPGCGHCQTRQPLRRCRCRHAHLGVGSGPAV